MKRFSRLSEIEELQEHSTDLLIIPWLCILWWEE